MKELNNILKQVLTNQQVIMTVLSKNCDEGCKEMINYENGKTTELFARHVFDKITLNSLYGYIATESYIKNDNAIAENFILKEKLEKIKEILNEMISCYEQEYNRNLSYITNKYDFSEDENIELRTQKLRDFSFLLKGLNIFKKEISEYIESEEK